MLVGWLAGWWLGGKHLWCQGVALDQWALMPSRADGTSYPYAHETGHTPRRDWALGREGDTRVHFIIARVSSRTTVTVSPELICITRPVKGAFFAGAWQWEAHIDAASKGTGNRAGMHLEDCLPPANRKQA